MEEQKKVEGVSEEILLNRYMEERDCEWRCHELREKIRESNGFQLELASTRFNEALRNLWNSIPWWRKILIRVISWLNPLLTFKIKHE